MNSIVVLLVCVQACLIENVIGQCLGNYGPTIATAYGPAGHAPYGYSGYADFGYPAAGWGYDCGLDAYGGVGEGNVAVAGELPVAGSTVIAGQVPITGAVRFVGEIPAAGVVSISGNCACGCNNAPYFY